MDQDKQKRTTTPRMSGGNSQAQAYVTNQRQHNQQMISPTIQSRSHSAFSTYLRGQHQQQRQVPPRTPHLQAQTFPIMGSPPPKLPQGLENQLFNFWVKQYEEVEEATDFRTSSLPLARIRKIMKTDEDVRMISADACVVFAKACEMFIKELTMRSWVHAEKKQRRTLNRSDIATAIANTEVFDFLVDTVPGHNTMKHDVCYGIQEAGSSSTNIEIAPNVYHMAQPRNVVGPPYGLPRVIMGRSVPNQPRFENLITHRSSTARIWSQPQQNDAPNSDDN